MLLDPGLAAVGAAASSVGVWVHFPSLRTHGFDAPPDRSEGALRATGSVCLSRLTGPDAANAEAVEPTVCARARAGASEVVGGGALAVSLLLGLAG